MDRSEGSTSGSDRKDEGGSPSGAKPEGGLPPLSESHRTDEAQLDAPDYALISRGDLFLSIAVESGFLSEAQMEDLGRTAEEMRRLGLTRSVARIAAEKGYLSDEDLSAVAREMVRRGVMPRLGGYELLGKLGEGGMGEVYKARQVSLDRIVALKTLTRERARDNTFVERFRREALMAARLTHPNSVRVFDVGESMGRCFLAMEYVDGASADRLLERGPLAEKRAVAIARGVAAALAEAHALGIVHRDIKPSNILVARDGTPKLADLGIARETGAQSAVLTMTGMTVGTPHYMSPEQCAGGRKLDARSDIYSLGATLYHLVCGRPPYDGDSALAIVQRHLRDPLPDPKAVDPTLSDGLCELMKGMMAKGPHDRPSTCGEVVDLLDRCAADSDSGDPNLAGLVEDAAEEEKSRIVLLPRRVLNDPHAAAAWMLCATAVAVLAMVATLAYLRRDRSPAPEPPRSQQSGPSVFPSVLHSGFQITELVRGEPGLRISDATPNASGDRLWYRTFRIDDAGRSVGAAISAFDAANQRPGRTVSFADIEGLRTVSILGVDAQGAAYVSVLQRAEGRPLARLLVRIPYGDEDPETLSVETATYARGVAADGSLVFMGRGVLWRRGSGGALTSLLEESLSRTGSMFFRRLAQSDAGDFYGVTREGALMRVRDGELDVLIPAPEMAEGETLNGLSHPAFNRRGDVVAFVTRSGNEGLSPELRLYRAEIGAVERIQLLREGEAVPILALDDNGNIYLVVDDALLVREPQTGRAKQVAGRGLLVGGETIERCLLSTMSLDGAGNLYVKAAYASDRDAILRVARQR